MNKKDDYANEFAGIDNMSRPYSVLFWYSFKVYEMGLNDNLSDFMLAKNKINIRFKSISILYVHYVKIYTYSNTVMQIP